MPGGGGGSKLPGGGGGGGSKLPGGGGGSVSKLLDSFGGGGGGGGKFTDWETWLVCFSEMLEFCVGWLIELLVYWEILDFWVGASEDFFCKGSDGTFFYNKPGFEGL